MPDADYLPPLTLMWIDAAATFFSLPPFAADSDDAASFLSIIRITLPPYLFIDYICRLRCHAIIFFLSDTLRR